MNSTTRFHGELVVELQGRDHTEAPANCRIVPTAIDWDQDQFSGAIFFDVTSEVAGFSGRMREESLFIAITTFLENLQRVRERRPVIAEFSSMTFAIVRVNTLKPADLFAVRVNLYSSGLSTSVAESLLKWPDCDTPMRMEAAFVMDDAQMAETIRQGEAFVAAMRKSWSKFGQGAK